MPRFPNRIVAVAVNHPSADDDEDNDICPVCDGDCTCNNRPSPLPSSVSHGSARFVATPTASTNSSAHALGAQPLKIKLTVPPSIQNKPRAPASTLKKSRIEDSSIPPNGVAGSSSASFRPTSTSSTAGHGQQTPIDAAGIKRKGRLSKAAAIPRDGTTTAVSDRKIRGNVVNTLSRSLSHHAQRPVTSRGTRPQVETPKSQAKGTIVKRSAPSKKKQAFFSDLTDSDPRPDADSFHRDDGDDPSLGRFPTFVSADGLTSEASDSSDSDSDMSGFGSDSSLAAEEENYIVAEQRRHEKARIRRELLGDDVPKHKDSNNSWVIRPRKKSVGLSDVDMEGDTDDITEEDDDEEEMEEDDDEEDDDETGGRASRVYTGLATGWSDDEESSFDADLFFDNLTDTSDDDDDDDDDSDTDGSQLHDSATDPLANSITSLRSVDIEVTEAWDGQVVFTNGSNDGHGVLDLAFEANAAQLLASDSASISHDSDVEMRASDGTGDDFDGGNSELGASDGDTTEEELVDEQGLPTSRAMRLFQWPTSVSSINPLSTVSPNVSPAPLSRRHSMFESPRPADILSGKVFWEPVDQSHQDSAEGSAGESPRPVRAWLPIMGQFNLGGSVAQNSVVLTGTNKDVPSPYPRSGHRRRRFSSSAGSFSSMDLRGRTARLSIYPSLSPTSGEPSCKTAPDIALGEPIKLDDVLDSTYLDSEPEMEMSAFPVSEGEQRLAQSLSRWDRVPVGAFRLTRESAASTSDVPTSPGWTPETPKSSVPEVRSYGNALKSSPLHSMLWDDKSGAKEKRKSRVVISPILLPVREGDRTPPHVPYHYDFHSNHRQQQHAPFKSRKESRREMRMMKRKTNAPSQQHSDHHQRYYRRNHHPNMKSRGNASVQRTFFGSPTSAPALNI